MYDMIASNTIRMSCALAPMQEFVPVSLYLYPSIPAAGVLFYSLSFGHSQLVNRQKHAHQTGGRLLLSLSLSLAILCL